MPHRVVRTAVAFVLLLGLAACSEDPQEKFREAREQLEARQAELEEARKKVDRKQEAVDAAREALEKARERVDELEKRVAKARQAVREVANDDVLFRAVQTRLLTELEDVAVDADVSDGVVTLSGQVPDEEMRDRAIELAREVPGVVEVKSRLRVPPPPAPGS